MKRKFGIVGALAVCVFGLASCGGNKTSSDYKTYYTEDYETLNYLTSSKQKDSQFFADFVDGLMENDRLGNLVPCLAAENPTTRINNEGNTEWTFKLRDADWVTSEGEVYAKVKAQDWVDAAQYILTPTNNSQTTSMWFQFIVGAEDYYNSRVDNDATNDVELNKVGVKAVDEKTLVFTVIGQQAYFDSVLTYSAFFPVNGAFLQECGSSFGETKDDILYNGGYIMKNRSRESYIDLVKNDKYWDAEHVYIKNIHYSFVTAVTPSTTRELYEAGDIDGFAVNNSDAAGVKKYVTGDDGTGTVDNPVTDICFIGTAVGTGVYAAAFNFDRVGDEAFGKDNSKGMLKNTVHTAATYANTQKAILNTNFRKMFVYGFDYNELNEFNTGEGLGLTYQSKGWTIPNLCSADGKDYTYYFAAEFKKQNNLTEDVETIQTNLYNEATKDLVYNVAKAKEFAQAAYTELSAQGVTFPVLIETFGAQDAENQAYTEECCKKFEDAMTVNGVKMVTFEVFQPQTTEHLYDCFYYGNYDFTLSTGWAPDYADPLTFLNCYVIGGDAEDTLGLTGSALETQVLQEYTNMVKAANAITDPSKKKERYEAFAAAEYKLIYEDALIIPNTYASAKRVNITKVLPYTGLRASSGLSDSKNKYRVISSKVVTQAQYQALREAFREQGTNAAIEAVVQKILNGEI